MVDYQFNKNGTLSNNATDSVVNTIIVYTLNSLGQGIVAELYATTSDATLELAIQGSMDGINYLTYDTVVAADWDAGGSLGSEVTWAMINACPYIKIVPNKKANLRLHLFT